MNCEVVVESVNFVNNLIRSLSKNAENERLSVPSSTEEVLDVHAEG